MKLFPFFWRRSFFYAMQTMMIPDKVVEPKSFPWSQPEFLGAAGAVLPCARPSKYVVLRIAFLQNLG
jgi:hypothetical protein